MKKNYKVMPPPQKFLELPQIYAHFGSRPVVAYGCKVVNTTPMGGHVIAVQDQADEPAEGIKAYMMQLKGRFPEKEPIFFLCIREDAIIYDKGQGNVRTLPEIMEKKPTKAERAVLNLADETLAKALASALKDNAKTEDSAQNHSESN